MSNEPFYAFISNQCPQIPKLVSSDRCLDILIRVLPGRYAFITVKRTSQFMSSANSDLPPDRIYIAHTTQATLREWWPYNYTQQGRWNHMIGTLNRIQNSCVNSIMAIQLKFLQTSGTEPIDG